MVKKNTSEKKMVAKCETDASDKVQCAIQDFTDSLHGMDIDRIIEIATLIREECGNAQIEINYDEYFGSSVSLHWSRLETDEEFKKRLARSVKAKISAVAAVKTRREKKKADELKELARLLIKYPNGSK